MNDAPNELICAMHNRAGLIRLNRPKALNALTLDMIEGLEAFTHACARNPHIYGVMMEAEGRGFCAGGDIRTVAALIRTAPEQADHFYAREYQHNWTLQCFRKPHVALIDGVVMGGGVGISLYGTHRIAGEAMRFAMPETGIGFLPDIGGSWFLPRMPGMMGLFLGLTGRVCNRADSYYLGVATHCVPAATFPLIKDAMIEAEPIDSILDDLHEHPGASDIEKLVEPVNRLFAATTLDEIIKGLEREEGEWRDFARETQAILSKRSPLSLKVTFELWKRRTSFKSLKDALIVEYRVCKAMTRHPNFAEGVRAVIIDRDQAPHWQPSALAEIDDAFVLSLFEPPPEGDLILKDYWTPSHPS